MSDKDNIITVDFVRRKPVKPYTVKFLISLDQDKFLSRLLELGDMWLESNKIFAICFDITPPDQLELMKDYYEVIKHFPHSSRIAGQKAYIGSFAGQYELVVNEILRISSSPYNYEIVEFIK